MMMATYVQYPHNELPNGLTLLQINPDRAADLRKESSYFGWLFYRGSEVDQWVTLRKLSSREICEAYDQASDMNVLDATPAGGFVLYSKSGVRFA